MAAGAFGALLGIGEGIFDKVYNYWRDQQADYRADRDFDYQKHLQQDVFNREDTAVQRRMADLQAAGLNPNLAAGSAASAGAVVGRSNTPTTNFGSSSQLGNALDMAQHVAQLRNARLESKILNNQKIQSDYQTSLAKYEYSLDKLQTVFDRAALFNQLGVKDLELRVERDGSLQLWSPSFTPGSNGQMRMKISDSPLYDQLNWQYMNNKNSADLLQKDVNWYTADKVANMIGAGARSAAGFGSAYYNFNNHYKRR